MAHPLSNNYNQNFQATVEHMVPRAFFKNYYHADWKQFLPYDGKSEDRRNWCVSCKQCNSKKKNDLPDVWRENMEFMGFDDDVIEWWREFQVVPFQRLRDQCREWGRGLNPPKNYTW